MRRIIIHRSEPDEPVPYWVECPSLGIASMGDSIEDAIRMIREAIALHVEDLLAHGEPIPPSDIQDIPTVPVPISKKPLPRGTLQSIIRQAGLTPDEFLALLD